MAAPSVRYANHEPAIDSPEVGILGRLLLSFRGRTVPAWLRRRLVEAPPAGVTLFRAHNVRSPRQVRALTASIQAAAPDHARPFLIAADQEGGQLNALGEPWTQFPGAMALGATRDPALAERVGYASARELRAVGINVSYGPVLDVVASRESPTLGIRSFGDDADLVATLGAAFIRGTQRAGVAATGKHFPGMGRVSADSHLGLAAVESTRADLEAVELRPFAAAIDAGVRLVMSGHFALPAVTGGSAVPATLARAVMRDLLREHLGFEGVSMTDALDMRALPQDATQAVDVIAALQAGVDLLLTMLDRRANARIDAALRRAAVVGLLEPTAGGAAARVQALRRWLGEFGDPGLEVVGCAEHVALAREVAARSMTLVRDGGTLPLRLDRRDRLLAVMPRPRDLTPADTSSYVGAHLPGALRAHHPDVEEIVTSNPPTAAEIAAVRERAAAADLVVAGSINASPGSPQAELVTALVATHRPLVTVALRTPWDVLAYPAATTNVATYSILPASMDALAAALFGRQDPAGDPFPGRLPVALQ